jgi:hypothetical protein
MKRTTKLLLHKIYFDISNPNSFSSPHVLYKAAKKINKTISKDEVDKFLQGEDTYTLHKQIHHRFPRRMTIAYNIDSQWQADLCDMSTLSKENDGMKFILTVIDILSRFCFAIALKNKKPEEVVIAFRKIFKTSNRKPTLLQTDQGLEFLGSKFQIFLKKHKIKHFFTNSEVKGAIIERVNRTLKTKMFRYFTAKNTLRYIDILQALVDSYNEKIHRSIKMPPNMVNKKNQGVVFNNLYGNYFRRQKKKFTFNIGNHVRITKLRKIFRKGYLPQWTKEIFRIVDRIPTRPPVYHIMDKNGDIIQGIFYQKELQKIENMMT